MIDMLEQRAERTMSVLTHKSEVPVIGTCDHHLVTQAMFSELSARKKTPLVENLTRIQDESLF